MKVSPTAPAPMRRPSGNVTFEVMDAERLVLADESVDLVTSRFGLQIVTDPDAMLAEARRVLRPGGRLALTVSASGERCSIMHSIIGPIELVRVYSL